MPLVAALNGCFFNAPYYQGEPSDHFDGKHFFNSTPNTRPRNGDLIRWRLTRDPGFWPDYRDVPAGPKPVERTADGDLIVTFINHTTVLIQMDGINILTDPIYSQRCSPLSWAGPMRRRPPGIAFDDLPPIDYVLISHNHYDHLDVPTLKRLRDAHQPVFITGLGNAALLQSEGIDSVVEIDWRESTSIKNDLTIIGTPALHHSIRGVSDKNRSLWLGIVIKSRNGNVFFSGDSGYYDGFKTIGDDYGPFRLALLPIGAYKPRWFMQAFHSSPDEAVKIADDIRSRLSVPIHYGTFPLGDDGESDPLFDLLNALRKEPDAPEFLILSHGHGFRVPRLD
ncbi:MAG: MBL fold metallo-hydrolase [Planctomycetota bacterium]